MKLNLNQGLFFFNICDIKKLIISSNKMSKLVEIYIREATFINKNKIPTFLF
jgi:hypothetical protein